MENSKAEISREKENELATLFLESYLNEIVAAIDSILFYMPVFAWLEDNDGKQVLCITLDIPRPYPNAFRITCLTDALDIAQKIPPEKRESPVISLVFVSAAGRNIQVIAGGTAENPRRLAAIPVKYESYLFGTALASFVDQILDIEAGISPNMPILKGIRDKVFRILGMLGEQRRYKDRAGNPARKAAETKRGMGIEKVQDFVDSHGHKPAQPEFNKWLSRTGARVPTEKTQREWIRNWEKKNLKASN